MQLAQRRAGRIQRTADPPAVAPAPANRDSNVARGIHRAFADRGRAPVAIDTLATQTVSQPTRRSLAGRRHARSPAKIGSNLSMRASARGSLFILSGHTGDSVPAVSNSLTRQCHQANHARCPGKVSDTALGPKGTDFDGDGDRHAQGFSALALPAEYVSQAGPFERFAHPRRRPHRSAATLSAAVAVECRTDARDLVARHCSNVFMPPWSVCWSD